jgi:DNA-binding beta-propeller fold protein YncE
MAFRPALRPIVLVSVLALSLGSAAWSDASSVPAGPRVLRYDGSAHEQDIATSVAVSPDGRRAFVTGFTYAGPLAGTDFATIAYNARGDRLWLSKYNGTGSSVDDPAAVAVAPDGMAVYVTGNSFGGPSTSTDMATVAYDAVTGDEMWVARYDGPAHDTDAATALVADHEAVYVTGASIGADGTLDFLTVAYHTATGAELWTARHQGPGGSYDEAFALAVSHDGMLLVTGYDAGTGSDFATVAYDAATGDEMWVATLDGPGHGDDAARSIRMVHHGHIAYVTGFASTSKSDADYMTAAYEVDTGRRLWVSFYSGPGEGFDDPFALMADLYGSKIFVTGGSPGSGTDSDYATVAYDAGTGAELWASRYDGPGSGPDRGDSLAISPDGFRLYVTGSSWGDQEDYLTLQLDPATGAQLRQTRYDGPGGEFDSPNAMVADAAGTRLWVTGGSAAADGVEDFATLLYLIG